MTERTLRPVPDEVTASDAETRGPPVGFALQHLGPRPTDVPADRGPHEPSADDNSANEPLMRELIGELLRRTRKEQNRTLREVADDAQVSLPYLSEIERGRKEASSEVLAAVARALGMRLVDLLGIMHMDLAAPAAPVMSRPVGAPAGSHQALLLAA